MIKFKLILKQQYDKDIENYCKLKNLPYDQLSYLGKGNNGQAYKIDKKVLKITTSKSEVYFNQKIFNSDDKYYYIAQVYDVTKIDSYRYAILKQFLLQDIIIEDVFDTLQQLNVDVSNLNYFDIQDIEDQYLKDKYYELQKYIDQIRLMYNECRQLGVSVPDIHSQNIGIDHNGNCKLMDIDDKNKRYDIYVN